MFRFTGEQRDTESGMYYLRARYYDPMIGRFLSQDPIPGGNLYAYVGNNPVNFVDPTGLHTWEGGKFEKLSPESLKELLSWLEHGRIRGHDVHVVMCLEDGSCLLRDCHGGSDLTDCTEVWITDSQGFVDFVQEVYASCAGGIFDIGSGLRQLYFAATTGDDILAARAVDQIERGWDKCS